MLKLTKYLKPYVITIIIAITFIFIQAMADLTLPDYMSNIVNKGIQQGGIVNAVPIAVRKSQMDKLILFMSKENKEEVLKNYTLVDNTSNDYDKYVKDYPLVSKEPIYILKKIDKTEIDKINLPIAKAIVTVDGIQKAKANAKNGVLEFNGQKIPANIDIFALMSQLPQSELQKISEQMDKRLASLGDNMIIQAATTAIKDEYKAIGMNTDKIQNNYIIKTGLLMLLITLLSALCTVLIGYFAAKVAAGLARDLRKFVFTKVENFSNAEFDKFSTASLITRTTNDITQVQMLMVIMIRMIFYAPIMGVGGVFKALAKSSSMSWTIALAVIVLLGLILLLFSIAMPKFMLMQKLIDRLNLVIRENLSGIMVIRAFNNQKFEEDRFDKANTDITKVGLFVNRAMAVLFPAMMFIMNGVSILIVWVGAHQIQNSSMQVGDMMAFMQYAMQIIFSFLMLSMLFIMIPRASVSANRVAEVLNTEPTIIDPKTPKQFNKNMSGTIEFKNVSFRYPGAEEDALKNINFKILPGQTTAIIGRTGSGKTTLINLLLRFYDPTSGEILIDGVNIKDVTQHELRSKIGYVPQKSWLFSGTIESNLRYGKEDATFEEIKEAAEIAQAMEFINEKPKKFETEIAQGGTNVSGGQKQRLSIARALIKKPEIYIFDESFSALDFKTESALRKAIKERLTSSTVIMVSQRVSTIVNADQIIVLEDGEIVGIGKHKELLKNCETYREIALSQLSEEELA
ncbi:ABC transporter ATP-binding protein [Caldicellulosiruptoraceae bacterium PP1]